MVKTDFLYRRDIYNNVKLFLSTEIGHEMFFKSQQTITAFSFFLKN